MLMEIDIPQNNMIVSEEENLNSSVISYEKVLPKTFNIHDFIKFFEPTFNEKIRSFKKDRNYVEPHLSVVSPPPEF